MCVICLTLFQASQVDKQDDFSKCQVFKNQEVNREIVEATSSVIQLVLHHAEIPSK